MLTRWLAAGLLAWAPAIAAAAPAEGAVETSSHDASGRASARADAIAEEAKKPFIKRHAPRRGSWHLGVSAGVFLPSRGVDLRESGLPIRQFERAAGDLAFRGGYYPLRFLGIELEGTVMPGGRVVGSGEGVTFYSLRGQAILQLPFWRVVPFASLGGGGLGVRSDAAAGGDDLDGMMSWGGGLKFHLTRNVGLRLDVRTNLSEKAAGSDLADSEEVLFGVLVRLGPRPRPKAAKAPGDRDEDGFVDPEDRCPDTPGITPDGCPARDTDGDGIVDPEDRCPTEKGDAPTGCPPKDGDGDGIVDEADECPTEAGPAPSGCPIRDRDSDGIVDEDDKCPDEPETTNAFQDEDGCPDVPPHVEQFTGVIEGIFFELDKATIRPESRSKLEEVVATLTEHPELRIEISGHTDSTGSREHNMDLSRRRADAVRDHLVAAGIDGSRIETRGAGPDEPIDSNANPEGRAKNRRIEFRVLD